MTDGTINDITNLKFYSDAGYEIPMQKQYILTWEIIPSGVSAEYVKTNPSGYFIGDVDLSDSTNIKIKKKTMIAGFINNGEIFTRYSEAEIDSSGNIPMIAALDENNKPIFSYANDHSDEVNASTYQGQDVDDSLSLYYYVHDMIFNLDNEVKVSINIEGQEYSNTFNILEIFDNSIQIYDEYEEQHYEQYITRKKVYVGNNLDNNNEYYVLLGLDNISLTMMNNVPFIQRIFEQNVPNLGYYFPFVRYSGEFYQDKISSGFVAANTIIVLEENKTNNEITYEKPYIKSNNQYSLVFQPSGDGELKIISSSSLSEISYVSEAAFSLADKETSSNYVTPFSFAIGFKADVEGAYQNFLGLYMRSLDNTNIAFFMGCMVIKTEVEGEDERFRTLLGNFGVIDPIKYPNLFAEQDYQEEGKDFTLINKKSKELMLTYDQIFSYIGTYKALLNAVKFLGYTDIIFKEWYTLKDSNDQETDIAVQIFDTESGTYLKQKLADYGVSIEDFNAYNKINRLSMIYHLNEIDDDNYEYIDQHLVKYQKATYNADGSIQDPSTMVVFEKYIKLSEVPLTKPIYEYRNEETLAKLFGIKKWLEANVIGVNAYISDISGEGIYFGWHKSQAYTTQHHLADYSQEQYYTADVKSISEFKNSSALINCTLTELNNGVKFCEYENVTIEAFDKLNSSIQMKDTTGVTMDIDNLIISNTIEAPVLGDEYEFDLMVRPDYGTLCEWTTDGSSQILYNTGELNLLFDKFSEAKIKQSCLPIITLENANIHKCYGSWTKNIEWSIKEVIDQSTGNTNYRLKNVGKYRSDSHSAYDNNYFVLIPSYAGASIKYSENNKYHLPMLIIKGYEFDRNSNSLVDVSINQYTLGDENEYILEIIKGDLLFKQVGNVGAQLSFSNDLMPGDNTVTYTTKTYEQDIAIQYTYHSDKKQITFIDSSTIQYNIDSSIFDYHEEIDQLNNNTLNINEYFEKIAQDRKEYISDPNRTATLVSYENASSFINSSSYYEELSKFYSKIKEQKTKELLYNDFVKIYNNNYIFNSSIQTNVNRLGNYDVICRAYDKYNNIFVNKYAKTANVIAKPISIDLFITQSNSNNNSDFYRFNTDGKLCDSSTIDTILAEYDNEPLFPKNYHIYDFDYDSDLNRIEFDNLSYAIDSPKNNNYVIFDNLTEICTGAEKSDKHNYTILHMLDENPNRVYLYNPSTDIKIIVYDNIEQRDFIYAGPYHVENSYHQDTELDESYQDESWISIDASLPQKLLKSINNTKRYLTYVLNVTEHTLSKDNLYDTDYSAYTTSLIFPNYYDINEQPYQIYNVQDLIKIRYYIKKEIDGNFTNIINEATYRITDIQKVEIEDPSTYKTYNQYVYVINGLINELLLDGKQTKIVLTSATHSAVHYVSRVVDDAREYNYGIGNGNYIIRDRFTFDSGQMMLDQYIDDTFSGIIYDYDAVNLKKTWVKPLLDSSTMELYQYNNFPVTVPQGKQLIFHHNDIDNILVPGYKVEWTLTNYTIDDVTNWYNHQNTNSAEILFRSINNYLIFKPEFVGTQNLELACIDKYGNKVVNPGSGILYVVDTDYTISDYQVKLPLIFTNDESEYSDEFDTKYFGSNI